MAKQRDSGSGRYLSKEDAATRDASTFTKEKDFNKRAFLRLIFDELKDKVEAFDDGEGVVSAVQFKHISYIFDKYGLKI